MPPDSSFKIFRLRFSLNDCLWGRGNSPIIRKVAFSVPSGQMILTCGDDERLDSRVGNQSTTSTVLINMLTSIHVNVNPRDMLLRNQSIHGWGLVD